MKALGAEIKQFYLDWPPDQAPYSNGDWYLDYNAQEVMDNADNWVIKDEALYELSDFGVICWQRVSNVHRDFPSGGFVRWSDSDWDVEGSPSVPFEKWFKAWRKARTVKAIVVEVPNEQVDAFKARCKDQGIKVIK